jgi:3-ketoacyl-CoA synthase
VEVERREALTLALKAILVTAILLWYLGTKEKTVYLMDFACFEPPADWKVTAEQILELLKRTGSFTEDSLKFQERMMQQSGVGPSTAWPPGITQVFKGLPHNESAEMSRKEAEVSAVGVVRVIK